MNNSYLRNIAKYLDGKNFCETFIDNDQAKLQTLLSQLEKQESISGPTDKENILNHLYLFLLKNYRNDIIYKIEFIDKIDSFINDTNDSFIVNEFKAGRNLTDLAVFNGKSISFEIKSDLDTADNIVEQFKHYEQLFDYCYLITNSKKVHKLINKLPKNAGVIVSDESFEFSILRKAELNDHISFQQLFKILKKKEYMEIVRSFYHDVPSVPNTKMFKECYSLLSKVDFDKFKQQFLKKMKTRDYSIRISDLYKIDKVKRQGYLANSDSLMIN